MSRDYFIEAVQALPARDRETVEHNLKQLKNVLAKLELETAQSTNDKDDGRSEQERRGAGRSTGPRERTHSECTLN
jgi:hypothetical protein